MIPHDAFAAALLDPGGPCPPGLVCHNGSDPARRFAVYRNNVVVSLVDALADACPVTLALVGPDFFRAMAKAFVLDFPPASPVLAEYGDAFPGFIEGFPPAAELPYLPDVARLELLRLRALHAAAAAPLTPEGIAAALADPDRLPGLRLACHPSVGVLASRHAVVSLWAAHQGLGELETVDLAVPEQAMVVRTGLEVNVVRLAPGGDVFIRHLADGAPLGRAAALAVSAEPRFDLATQLAVLIRHGALSGFRQEGELS